MKLQEYQAKSLLKQAGIPVPVSMLATNAVQVKRIASEIGCPVVLKAQILERGRGKAGGIRLVQHEQEAEQIGNEIFKLEINHQSVQSILVEKAFTFLREYYLGIRSDLDFGAPVLRISEAGGATCLEENTFQNAKIVDRKIDIDQGLRPYQVRQLLTNIDIAPSLWKQFEAIALKLYDIYRSNDATLAEINSLVVTHQEQLYALDAKIIVDSQALYRQESFLDSFDPSYYGWLELQARKFGVTYHQFSGELGCIVNGMGLAYLTFDHLIALNSVPAAIIDIHGGSTVSSMASSLELLLLNDNIKAILINIYGGMTNCEEIAEGICAATRNERHKKPIFLRLKGTNDTIAINKLSGLNHLQIFDSTQELVEAALDYIRDSQ
ncbi:MAG: ATP-grasp domain-containing protein [Anaerolineaceae bacterium]|jgi:succinyl-CoA synthetase beta subunit